MAGRRYDQSITYQLLSGRELAEMIVRVPHFSLL